jgi:hypothetical protein
LSNADLQNKFLDSARPDIPERPIIEQIAGAIIVAVLLTAATWTVAHYGIDWLIPMKGYISPK